MTIRKTADDLFEELLNEASSSKGEGVNDFYSMMQALETLDKMSTEDKDKVKRISVMVSNAIRINESGVEFEKMDKNTSDKYLIDLINKAAKQEETNSGEDTEQEGRDLE
jgi:hypothetical protein